MIFLFSVIDMRFYILPIFSLILLCGANSAIAQSFTPTAVDGLTEVTPVGNNRWDITTKNPPSSSINQFHSFTNFNVGTNEIVNFIPAAGVQNILSRVTGGTPSQIQGVIQASGGVNLFLMNPSGILFGNGASLNVQGSFTATTANAIGFGNNNWFNAAGNNNYANLTGIPNQFAFTNANPGAIVNTGNLTLKDGKSLNLIGGTVINTGTITTPGGNVTIAAVEGGRAVQITEPGSLLSYIVPIGAINPAIGNPVSLPELLAGSPLDSANGIELNKDGVVTLVRSQTPLPDRSGLVVGGGSINSVDKTEIAGRTIALTNPLFDGSSKTGDKTAIQLTAADRIVFGNLGGNELKLGEGVKSLTMQTTAANGIIESLNPKDSIVVPNGTLAITSDSITLGNLGIGNFSRSRSNQTVFKISASSDVILGNLETDGSIEVMSTKGNIKVGRIDTNNSLTPTTITAKVGNIEVDTIQVGLSGQTPSETQKLMSLDIFAGGSFRVMGTQPNDPIIPDSYSSLLIKADEVVFNFLSTKTGKTDEDLRTAMTSGTPRFYVLAPVSISSRSDSKISIRYAGGTGEVFNPLPGITIQGGKSRFEVGAKASIGSGEAYLPLDSRNSFGTFFTSPFDIRQNITYSRSVLKKGDSGTVGAIVKLREPDGSLSVGVQDQVFGSLPTKPVDPNPINPRTIDPTIQKPNTPNTSTIDLENRPISQLTACPDKKTIVLTPPEANADRKEPTKPIKKNPCISNNDDDEILKILK